MSTRKYEEQIKLAEKELTSLRKQIQNVDKLQESKIRERILAMRDWKSLVPTFNDIKVNGEYVKILDDTMDEYSSPSFSIEQKRSYNKDQKTVSCYCSWYSTSVRIGRSENEGIEELNKHKLYLTYTSIIVNLLEEVMNDVEINTIFEEEPAKELYSRSYIMENIIKDAQHNIKEYEKLQIVANLKVGQEVIERQYSKTKIFKITKKNVILEYAISDPYSGRNKKTYAISDFAEILLSGYFLLPEVNYDVVEKIYSKRVFENPGRECRRIVKSLTDDTSVIYDGEKKTKLFKANADKIPTLITEHIKEYYGLDQKENNA